MPQIAAFRGLRYDLGHVGALEGVVAPPSDVIDAELQMTLYKQHPANVVRLVLNRDEVGDDEDAKYGRAARFFKNWQQEGVLQREPDPAIYAYHQVFEYAGSTYTRRGFICLAKLERFGEGSVYPHEETQASVKEDRLKLMRACKGNLSPIFAVYPDPKNEAQEAIETSIVGVAPIETKDNDGVLHRLWPISDLHVINSVASVMASKETYIADGHHRYETACAYKDELGGDDLDPVHSANHIMMMCVGINDPGMIVLPTHRLFRGLAAMSSDDLKAKLTECFDVRIAGEGSDLAEMIWDQIEIEDDQGTIGLYCHADERWVVAKINDAGRTRMSELAPDKSEEWRSLGVSILHRLIMETLLAESDLPIPKYVHLVDDVITSIDSGDSDNPGESFELAALVMPATLAHIQMISEQGERMPAKSTYFFPKLLSGLVLFPHDGS